MWILGAKHPYSLFSVRLIDALLCNDQQRLSLPNSPHLATYTGLALLGVAFSFWPALWMPCIFWIRPDLIQPEATAPPQATQHCKMARDTDQDSTQNSRSPWQKATLD